MQEGILLWKDEWETVIENSEPNPSGENKSDYWFSYDELKKIISMNIMDHLESEQRRIYENIQFLIDNKKCLCDHGFLHTMKERKGKYTPENLYNHMKEIFRKIGIGRSIWDFIKVMIILHWLVMWYQRVKSNVKNVQDNCGIIWQNKSVIEITISLSPVIE